MNKKLIDKLKPMRRLEYLIKENWIKGFDIEWTIMYFSALIISSIFLIDEKIYYSLFALILAIIIFIVMTTYRRIFYCKLNKEFIDEVLK